MPIASVSSPPRSRFLREVEVEDYGNGEHEQEEDEDGGQVETNEEDDNEDDSEVDCGGNRNEQHQQQVLPIQTPLQQTTVHIGWITHQPETNTFLLEKGFRALRSWLTGPDSWKYDLESIKASLRVQEAAEVGLHFELYWFENLANGP